MSDTAVKKLFARNIERSINGVVKADQQDAASVWQELDEFVITSELSKHIGRFFSSYATSIEHPNDPDVTGRIGVWVSGFFGSGKSHFIKVLSYLLANRELHYQGQTKRAMDFFTGKIADAMVMGDIKRSVREPTDVILFNIDSKAASSDGRDAILRVFLRVFNEHLSYCGDYPHVAHFERHLDKRGKLQVFQEAFERETGSHWEAERDAYHFHYDEVVKAWCEALGESESAAEKWLDNAEESFPLTVENFCKWVKEYLDSCGPKQRIIFLVDEIGQFIGNDGHLMLNLQTLVENLGTVCEGRAWVVVTSQEEIDRVIGDITGTKANDFSKITGRFKTRLSLSSSNADEVIQERLLKKRDEVIPELEAVFADKGDILRNQLTFTDVGMTLRNYRNQAEFAANYPFAPFQFQLLQKIFEAIRKAGATGLHLSRGERSILDAFQSAAIQIVQEKVGVLVPLYRFYPSIESFLDTAVKRTIDQARDNASLEPMDIHLLEILFLIRYVDEVQGTVNNLVTLCIDRIDADRLTLRRQIEESLARLEKEPLISRSGDRYYFLTNEERDINREIKKVELTSSDEVRLFGELMFDDVLGEKTKHRYAPVGKDFSVNRQCDLLSYLTQKSDGLVFHVLSPLFDQREEYGHERCLLFSSESGGQVVARLREHATIDRELRQYLRIDKYNKQKNDGTLGPATLRILQDLADENRLRRQRLVDMMGTLLVQADIYAAGQQLDLDAKSPDSLFRESMDYLIANTFPKMGYIKHTADEPLKELQSILRSNDPTQQQLAIQAETSNSQAIDEIRQYVDLSRKANRTINLHDMLTGRFAGRPYGWPEWESLLLVARLVVIGELNLLKGGGPVAVENLYNELSTISRWRQISVVQRRMPPDDKVKEARALGKDVFQEMGPDAAEPLVEFLHARLKDWQETLGKYKPLAETGNYPGCEEIERILNLVAKLVRMSDSYSFVEALLEARDDLLDASEDFHDLHNFYQHQRHAWESLSKSLDTFKQNEYALARDEKAASALRRMREIREARAPYGLIKDAEELTSQVAAINQGLVKEHRQKAIQSVEQRMEELNTTLDEIDADTSLRERCLQPLRRVRQQVEGQQSLPHIAHAHSEATRLFDEAIVIIESAVATPEPTPAPTPTPEPTPAPTFKKRQVIKPTDLVKHAKYLETQEDVDAFLNELRERLEQAIANGERVEIR